MIESNLKQRLQALRGTLKKAIALNGLGRLIVALTGCFLLALFLDYFIFRWDRPINTAFRVLMLLSVLGTLGWIAYYKLIAPLSVPLDTDDMALAVEKEFPNLNDSLISTMQLTRMLADDENVSTPMVDEVARQAHQATAALDFNNVVKFQRIKPVLVSSGIALAAFVLLLAFLPHAKIALWRLANPFSNVKYPVATHVHIKGGPEEIVWPRGESLKIVAEVSGSLPNIAYIHFDHGSGFGAKEPITTVRTIPDLLYNKSTKEFEFEYNPVNANFKFEVIAGDDQSSPRSVRAVDRPRMENIDVVYKYPAYISDTPSEPKRDTTIIGVAGTTATITVMANKALKEAQLKLGNDQPRVITDFAADGKMFAKQIDLDVSKDYEITLLDTDGLDNSKSKIRHKIIVKPDAVPRVTWRRPAADLEVSPAAIVSLGLTADDDFGLQKAVIKFKRYHMIVPPAPAGGQNAPQPVVDASTPAIEGTFDLAGEFAHNAQKLDFSHEWALSDLALQPTDMIEYWAEAYDWCPTKRKQAEPQIFRLKVLSINAIHQLLDIQRMRLVEDLIAIIRMEEADKKQVTAIREHLSFGNPFDTTQRGRVSEAGSLQEEARRKTQALQKGFEALIARYKSNSIDTPDETDRLRLVADQLGVEHSAKMPDASKTIVSSAMLKDDPARVEQLKQAEVKQVEILADLNNLLAMMQKWAETEELLRMTRELLAKQKIVTAETVPFKDKLGAKQPADASKEELSDVKGLEHKERDCASDMKILFVRMTQALAKMQSLDKFAAKNIEDSIKVAQNTDATSDNPNITATGDPTPGIEDKMTGAQNDIAKFNFGTANGKQRASETALQTIITYLSRRKKLDEQLMRDIDAAKKELQRILDEQKQLTRQDKAIKDKQDLMKSIAEAKQRLNDLKQLETGIRDQTHEMSSQANSEAAKLDAALAEAKKDIEGLIAEETAIKTETDTAMSQPEADVAKTLGELEEIEITERALAKDTDATAKLAGETPSASVLKKAEKAMTDNADKQADTRNLLDDIAARMAAMVRAGSMDKVEAKTALAGKAAAIALPELESASHDMAEATDTLRKGSGTASQPSLAKSSALQISAADKIAKARKALKNTSMEMGKDKKGDFEKTGGKQEQTQTKAAALKDKLAKLGADIDKAHAAASGNLEKPAADPASASAKMGEAAEGMSQAKDDLKKPDPASATKDESKALDAMQKALEKIKDMQRKVDEVKDPPRRLERVQKEVKDATRQLAEDIKNIEGQLPSSPLDPKAEDNLKKAANSMQNAQNSLGGSKSKDSKSGDGSKSGEGSKSDDKKKDDKADSSKGDKGDQNKNDNNKGGDANKKDAEKHEEQALSELDKALKALDELAKKAEKEGPDHKEAALKRLQEQQNALRESVQKLQPKLNEMKEKTGNDKAASASKSNESAGKNQSKAAGQMGQGKQDDASKSQEDAEQDLQEALDNLNQFEKQVKDQQNKEKLFQIEQELKKMLEAQTGLIKRTADTDKLPAGRPKKLTLIQVFKDQLALSDATKVVVKMLEEAPVFQFVLEAAVEDMTEAATRLDKENSGTGTQEIQEDAAKKIADLIEALRKERTKPKSGGGGGGGGGGKQPLVPSLAQMKMLLIMQKDVGRRIKSLDTEVTKGNNPDLNKDQKDRLRRAAEQEGKISRITEKTAQELEGKQVPQPLDKKDPGN